MRASIPHPLRIVKLIFRMKDYGIPKNHKNKKELYLGSAPKISYNPIAPENPPF